MSTVILLAAALLVQDPVAERAGQVVQALADPTRITGEDLSGPMRRQVGEARLRAVLQTLHAQVGDIQSWAQVERLGQHAARFRLRGTKGLDLIMTLTVEARPPHRIAGLLFGPPVPSISSLAALEQELRSLPGDVAALVVQLTDEPQDVLALQPDKPLAIGSTFKLYVLATLTRVPDPWRKVVHLSAKNRSLPSGVLHKWPVGAPVTIHTLAVQMISVSDNTATDHLIDWLGRERIEESLSQFGHSRPELMRPFLKTRELFQLKADPDLVEQYTKLDEQGRRRLLAERLTDTLPSPYDIPVEPRGIESVEWFASCRDLVRLMDYFRRLEDPTAREIIAVNPGLPGIERNFEYVGYKGGSEAGVLNLSWLLRTRDGRWYAVVMTWNDAQGRVDEVKFVGLAQAALDLVARQDASPTR